MKWLFMLEPEKSSNRKQRIAYLLVALCVLSFNINCVAAHLAFFLKYLRTDLNKSMFALMGVIPGSGSVYVEIIGIIFRHRMPIIYEQISDIFNSGKWFLEINIWKLWIFKSIQTI